VAIGVGASNHPVSAPLVTGAIFGVLISLAGVGSVFAVCAGLGLAAAATFLISGSPLQRLSS